MTASATRETFFATCSPGLERFLLSEVRALGLAKAEGQPGGVQFTGTDRDAWTANLELRTASRVLLRVGRYSAPHEAALYEGARDLPWERFVRPDGTFAVHSRSSRSAVDNTMFAAQRVKDAVADRFREKFGRRPDVKKDDPDVRVHVHLASDRATLLADTSGPALHRRGWRRFQGEAQLKENVAAACVLASGWDRRAPLLDPFCGSGTILVEGALLAGDIAPGRFREAYSLERWPGHEAEAFAAIAAATRARGEVPGKLTVLGADADGRAVAGARDNVEGAGLKGRVDVRRADVSEFAPKRGWNAFVVTNPPYGQRVGKGRNLGGLYRTFGEALKKHCGGYTVAMLHQDPAHLKATGFSAERIHEMKNGPLDCRLAVFQVPR